MTSTTAGPHSAVATSTTVVSEVVNTATGHQDGPSTSNQQHPQPTAPVSERLILRLVPKKKKKGKVRRWRNFMTDAGDVHLGRVVAFTSIYHCP